MATSDASGTGGVAAIATATPPEGGTRWKRPASVLVVVHAAAGQVLLLQRADDPRFWQSVTGSLEDGEVPGVAARRELHEETGLDVAPTDLALRSTFAIRGPWRARYAPSVTHNVEHAFAVRLERACAVTLHPEEHLAYRWLAVAEALALASSPTDRAAIRLAALGVAAGDGAWVDDGSAIDGASPPDADARGGAAREGCPPGTPRKGEERSP